MVVLGKTSGVVHEKTNVLRYEDEEEYLLATVFKVAEVEPTIHVIENVLADESDFPSTSNPTASSSSMLADQVEEDGLNYLSGWLARKFNKTYPEMGDYTYMLKYEEHSFETGLMNYLMEA
ncbi:hypothetical protein JTB14_005869 [Gonioctena quinquepunctata]|nr:hypothetical protein JTB14_005869 [Gonioctena quinquepunctata]